MIGVSQYLKKMVGYGQRWSAVISIDQLWSILTNSNQSGLNVELVSTKRKQEYHQSSWCPPKYTKSNTRAAGVYQMITGVAPEQHQSWGSVWSPCGTGFDAWIWVHIVGSGRSGGSVAPPVLRAKPRGHWTSQIRSPSVFLWEAVAARRAILQTLSSCPR